MATPVKFSSWFPVPRHIMGDIGGTPTEFDKNAPAEMRLYLRLLKIRRNPKVTVEISNAKLMEMTGLKDRTFRRARKSLVEWGLIADEPIDSTGEGHRYVLLEPFLPDPPNEVKESLGGGLALPVDCVAELISHDVLFRTLDRPATLEGKAATVASAPAKE